MTDKSSRADLRAKKLAAQAARKDAQEAASQDFLKRTKLLRETFSKESAESMIGHEFYMDEARLDRIDALVAHHLKRVQDDYCKWAKIAPMSPDIFAVRLPSLYGMATPDFLGRKTIVVSFDAVMMARHAALCFVDLSDIITSYGAHSSREDTILELSGNKLLRTLLYAIIGMHFGDQAASEMTIGMHGEAFRSDLDDAWSPFTLTLHEMIDFIVGHEYSHLANNDVAVVSAWEEYSVPTARKDDYRRALDHARLFLEDPDFEPDTDRVENYQILQSQELRADLDSVRAKLNKDTATIELAIKFGFAEGVPEDLVPTLMQASGAAAPIMLALAQVIEVSSRLTKYSADTVVRMFDPKWSNAVDLLYRENHPAVETRLASLERGVSFAHDDPKTNMSNLSNFAEGFNSGRIFGDSIIRALFSELPQIKEFIEGFGHIEVEVPSIGPIQAVGFSKNGDLNDALLAKNLSLGR